ncbi:MAG: hypothetical protein JXB26_10750 [Candidatus Aminicenantes bacterium]|nr:hypothetical protein [Candidatus Aminicenantes bacterium]
MPKAKVFVSLFFFITGALFITAQDVNVTGDWELTIQTPRGERTQQAHFEQDGENLTVTMEGRQGQIEAKGTVKGNKIEWSVTRETPRGEFTMTYTGTVEGDTMSGEVQMGDFGSGEWSAKRVK